VSNPKPEQTAGALGLGWSVLDKIPILWTVVIVIAIIGGVYYLAAGRRQPFAPVIPPVEEAPAVGTQS
jgi:hypothetical protein